MITVELEDFEIADREVRAALLTARTDGFLIVGPGGTGDRRDYFRWEQAREIWREACLEAGFAAVEVDAISYPDAAVVSYLAPFDPPRKLPEAIRRRLETLTAGKLDDSFGKVVVTQSWSTEQMPLSEALDLARAVAECDAFC